MKKLISEGANVNGKDDSDNTPLHVAAVNGRRNVVSALCSAGAEVNVKNDTGDTPLHYSAYRGHWEVVKTLLSAKADIDATNIAGVTPLHMAALLGHTNIVLDLIGDLPVTTIEFAGCSRAISSTRRWNIAHRSTGSIDEAEADERQDTAGRSGGIGHEREVGAELE